MSRGIETRHRWGSVAAATTFAVQMVALDLVFRGATPYMHSTRTWLNALASVGLGSLVLTLRARRWARAVVAFVAGSLIAADVLVFRYYHTTIDRQVIASALHNWGDIAPVMAHMVPTTLLLAAPIVSLEYALLAAAGPPRSGRRRLPLVAAFLLMSVLALPLRLGTPELRALDAVSLAWAPRSAAAATSARVPLLPSRKESVPSVLIVLTESVRASSYCGDPSARCDRAPEVSALLPGRIAFTQMRSIASYTAVAVSALLTGQTQTGSREAIQQMPTLFDFVRSVRVDDAAPRVSYWSAQLSSLFERSDVAQTVDSFTTLENLVGTKVEDEDDVVDRGVDRLLADYAEKELRTRRDGDATSEHHRPELVMLHFAGTHAPYFVEPSDAPWQPWRRDPSWSGLPALEHAYANAIHEQDKSIARAIRAFIDTRDGAPWIVVLTSDHGEAFGEHGAIHHGQGLYDEQIHVPAFVAFSPGTLTEAEDQSLRAASSRETTHLDVVPTLLDVYGVLDTFALDPLRKALRGRSLLRPLVPLEPVPITNCTTLFPCPISTWGMLGDNRTLLAQPWDSDWRCVQHAPTSTSTTALVPVGDPACAILRAASRAPFPEMPNHARNAEVSP